jgi:hypothetical protein
VGLLSPFMGTVYIVISSDTEDGQETEVIGVYNDRLLSLQKMYSLISDYFLSLRDEDHALLPKHIADNFKYNEKTGCGIYIYGLQIYIVSRKNVT